MVRWHLVPLVLLLTACAAGPTRADGRSVAVVAAFFPLEDLARAVAGDLAGVSTMVPAGREAHVYEPTPKQVGAMERADVVLYLKGFQPAVDDAVSILPRSVRKVDLGAGLRVGDDPHVWLDPVLMQEMAQRAADALGAADPAHATAYRASAAAYVSDLATLDAGIRAGLATCISHDLVTSHDAFGYFARRYALTVVPIGGISPDVEPSPKQLQSVAAAAEAHHVRTVFFEDNLPPDLARTVAEEIGVGTAALDSLESPSTTELRGGETYVSAMTANLSALRTGLGCQ